MKYAGQNEYGQDPRYWEEIRGRPQWIQILYKDEFRAVRTFTWWDRSYNSKIRYYSTTDCQEPVE